jgi:hypothetical protein
MLDVERTPSELPIPPAASDAEGAADGMVDLFLNGVLT